jgi:hypothetical protein
MFALFGKQATVWQKTVVAVCSLLTEIPHAEGYGQVLKKKKKGERIFRPMK